MTHSNRRLHIGGTIRVDGWEVMNAVAGPQVDHLGDARDLSRFADGTFAVIYASHVLEHFDYAEALPAVLREWFRALRPGGTLQVSVPDLDTLAAMLLMKETLSLDDRFYVMRMLFGGHADAYDYHQTGLNREFLERFLEQAGFVNIRRVENFGLFHDTSEFRFRNIPVSLNLSAEKPRPAV